MSQYNLTGGWKNIDDYHSSMYFILAFASMALSVWLALKSVKAENAMTINDSTGSEGMTVYFSEMNGGSTGNFFGGIGYLEDRLPHEEEEEGKSCFKEFAEKLEEKTAILHHPHILAVLICMAFLLAVIFIYFWFWLAKHGF